MFRMICFAATSLFAVTACGSGEEASKETETVADMQDPSASAGDHPSHKKDDHHKHEPIPAPAAGEDMRVHFIGTDGQKNGEAVMVGGPLGMLIRVDLMGMSHGFHGVHLHQIGDCSDFEAGFKASGSHINPEGMAHGLMNAAGYERADLPNVYAHHSGHVRAELFVAGLSIIDAMDEDGFALVVHQNPDDHMSQPIGGAGPRVACAAFKVN